jgi:hypothetical protein
MFWERRRCGRTQPPQKVRAHESFRAMLGTLTCDMMSLVAVLVLRSGLLCSAVSSVPSATGQLHHTATVMLCSQVPTLRAHRGKLPRDSDTLSG